MGVAWGGEGQWITWEWPHSAWEVIAMETASLLNYPGIGVGESATPFLFSSPQSHSGSEAVTVPCLVLSDPATPPVVERVTAVAQLVARMLEHDWSLLSHLQPITVHFFRIIQK